MRRRTRDTAESDQSRRKTLDAELGQRKEGVGSFGQHMVALFKKRLKMSLRDRMNWVLHATLAERAHLALARHGNLRSVRFCEILTFPALRLYFSNHSYQLGEISHLQEFC